MEVSFGRDKASTTASSTQVMSKNFLIVMFVGERVERKVARLCFDRQRPARLCLKSNVPDEARVLFHSHLASARCCQTEVKGNRFNGVDIFDSGRPTASRLSAKGAECNSLGQRPRFTPERCF